MTTTRVHVADLRDGDRIIEQGDLVTVIGDARTRGGAIAVDLDAKGNTYHYDPSEVVARVGG